MVIFDNDVVGEAKVSDSDARIVTECVLMESLSAADMDEVLENDQARQALLDDEIVTERTIVKMDKKARLSRATKAAVFAIARRKKDVKFKKLLTIWRMEREIEQYLYKKYKNEGFRTAKAAMKNKPLKSGNHAAAVKKAVATAKSQLNGAH